MKILFLLRDLGYGGTQRQLLSLAEGLQQRGHIVILGIFYGGGIFEKNARSAGVDVISLQKAGRWDVFSFALRTVTLLRRERPHVIYSFLDGPNVIAALLRQTYPPAKLVWGVRSSYVNWHHYSRVGYWMYRLAARLSRIPSKIIFNSQAGLAYHVSNGFCERVSTVIPNGIDTVEFAPVYDGANQVRRSWRVNETDLLIGLVGRLDGMKDVPTFIRAARIVADWRRDVKFLCIGIPDAEGGSPELARLVEQLGMQERVMFLDYADDMRAVYNALDIVASSSIGEGFPNVIAEAMACGKPCVATDAGDSALIVGDTGYIVSPGNADALAGAMRRMLTRVEKEGRVLSSLARERICKHFSRDLMVERTETVLQEVAGRGAPRQSLT